MGVPVDVIQLLVSGAALAKAGRWYGSDLYSTGNNAVDVVLYDNASAASGTIIGGGRSQVGSSVRVGPRDGNFVQVKSGIYVSVTGTAPVVDTHYSQSA